jgi:hypothetical protein
MALQWETGYTKNGQTINFKFPRLKVIGKEMDDAEEHTFKVLVDGIKEYKAGDYPNYSMFVKYEDEEDAFNLQLSKQAKNAIEKLNPEKGDLLHIKKGWYDSTFKGKDGKDKTVKKPMIVASIEGQESAGSAPKASKVPKSGGSGTMSPQAFAKIFKPKMEKMDVKPASLMFYVFAGAYLCKIKPNFKARVQKAYDEMVK